MEQVEEIFQNMHVFRSWMLCGSDADAMEATQWLDAHDHTVACITTDDLDDERLRFHTKLRDFEENTARMLVISYPAWHQIQEEIEVHVLPIQNLMLFYKVDEDVVAYVQRCMNDAAMRGFRSKYEGAMAVVLSTEEENVI